MIDTRHDGDLLRRGHKKASPARAAAVLCPLVVLSLLVALCCTGCGGSSACVGWTISASGESFEKIWSDALTGLGIPEADPVPRSGTHPLIAWEADGSLSRLMVSCEYSDSSGASLMHVFTTRLAGSQELSVGADRYKIGRDWPVPIHGVPVSRLFRAVDLLGYEGLLALGGATLGEGEGLMLSKVPDHLPDLIHNLKDEPGDSSLFIFQDEDIVELDPDFLGDYSEPVTVMALWKARLGPDSVSSICPALAYFVVR